jgi:hypothetical protein
MDFLLPSSCSIFGPVMGCSWPTYTSRIGSQLFTHLNLVRALSSKTNTAMIDGLEVFESPGKATAVR